MMISARNKIDTTIEAIEVGVVNALITLKTTKGVKLYANITNQSVQDMQLCKGDKVVAFFKASHILLATGWAMSISARNKLEGTVSKIVIGAVNAEVNIMLPEGDTLSAIITNDALNELALKENEKCIAIIKATDLMIAK